MKHCYGHKLVQCLLLVLMLLSLGGCKQQELLRGLDQRQANEVMALLQQNAIPAMRHLEKKEGWVISVGPEDFPAAVELITRYDLPGRPRIEIAQMFPADALISSPEAERARLYSAIEQRLEQSLLSLPGVIGSRLHLSYSLYGSGAKKSSGPGHIALLLKVSG